MLTVQRMVLHCQHVLGDMRYLDFEVYCGGLVVVPSNEETVCACHIQHHMHCQISICARVFTRQRVTDFSGSPVQI